MREITLKERIENLRELFKLVFAFFFGDVAGTLSIVRSEGFVLFVVFGVVSSLWLLIILVGLWSKLSEYTNLLEEVNNESKH